MCTTTPFILSAYRTDILEARAQLDDPEIQYSSTLDPSGFPPPPKRLQLHTTSARATAPALSPARPPSARLASRIGLHVRFRLASRPAPSPMQLAPPDTDSPTALMSPQI